MYLTGFNGTTFSDLGLAVVDVLVDAVSPPPEVDAVHQQRSGGAAPAFGTVLGRPVTLHAQFALGRIGANLDALLACLDFPGGGTEQTLVGQTTPGAVAVQRPAKVTQVDMTWLPGGLRVTLTSSQGAWTATTDATDVNTYADTHDEGQALAVGGQGTVSPRLWVKPTVQRTTFTSTLGWRYKKTITITNNTDKGWNRVPYRVSIGDTAALVTAAKIRSDGQDIRLWQNGVDLARYVIAFNTTTTYAWFILTLAAGATTTVDFMYGNPSAGAVPVFTYPDVIAFEYGGDGGTSSGSNTATTFNDTTRNWQTNQWNQGLVVTVAGTGSGQTRVIASNTATQLTVTSAWTTTPDATTKYFISMSDNGRWNWYVAQNDYGAGRGGYYLNRGTRTPSVIDYEVPGAWKRYNYLANNDNYNQQRWSSYTTSGTRYHGILEAERHRNSAGHLQDLRQADGMQLYCPFGITSINFDFTILNKAKSDGTNVGKFVLFSRESGGEAWEKAYEYATVQSALTNIGTQGISFAAPYPTFLAMVVLPADEISIPEDTAAGAWIDTRWLSVLNINVDLGASSQTLGSEVQVYELNPTIRALGGPNADKPPFDQIAVGGDGHRIAVPINNTLVIDTEARTVAEWDATVTSKIRDCPWAVVPRRYEGVAGVSTPFVSRDWLPLKPRPNPVTNPGFEANLTGWGNEFSLAGFNETFSRDTGTFAPGGSTASAAMVVAASTYTGNQAVSNYVDEADEFAVTPGQLVWVSADLRSSTANLVGLVNIAWYNASHTYVTGTGEPGYVPQVNTWTHRVWAAVVPAGIAYARIAPGYYSFANNATGTVWIDNVSWMGNELFFAEPAMGTVQATALWTPRYL